MNPDYEFTVWIETAEGQEAPSSESIANALYERFGDRDSEVVFAVEAVGCERFDGGERA